MSCLTRSSFTSVENPVPISGRTGNDSLVRSMATMSSCASGFCTDLVFGFDASSMGRQERMDISAMRIRLRPLPSCWPLPL